MTTQPLGDQAVLAIMRKATAEGITVPDTVDPMKYAEVCNQCGGAGQRSTSSEKSHLYRCPSCRGTGGEFPTGRAECVAWWLEIYGHCAFDTQLPGYSHEPIPQLLLIIEDVELGRDKIEDSTAIYTGMALAHPRLLADILKPLLPDSWEFWKPIFKQQGDTILRYRAHLLAQAKPTLEMMLGVARGIKAIGLPFKVDDLITEIPALIALLGGEITPHLDGTITNFKKHDRVLAKEEIKHEYENTDK